MKLAGKTQAALNVETVVLPRPIQRVAKVDAAGSPVLDEQGKPIFEEQSGDLVFTIAAVLDWEPLDKILPEPEVPHKKRPGDIVGEPVFDDPDYLDAKFRYGVARQNWLILESLKATKDLEWTTISPNQPDTWGNFRTEFKNFGLLPVEIGYILSAVYRVNSLSDDTLNAARERFLAMNPPQS